MQESIEVTGTNLDGKQVTMLKSNPVQMFLFQHFHPSDTKYSNSIEFYDAVPKYFASHKQMDALRENGKYLPTLRRTFSYRNPSTGTNSTYQIDITPARIDKDGQEREYYPTEREQLIEEALRKIAADQRSGIFLDDHAGVQFTLYQLQQELKKRGHSIKYPNLIEALTICNKCNLAIKNGSKKSVLASPIFPELIITSRDEWLKNPRKVYCYVQFNRLVTQHINALIYRQHDYVKFMGYRRQLTRWLHKKIWNNYIQAGIGNSYHIKASTIIDNSYLVNFKLFRQCVQAIDAALEELKDQRIIREFRKTIETQNGKIIDAKYDLFPTMEFITEMKAANKRANTLEEQAVYSNYSFREKQQIAF